MLVLRHLAASLPRPSAWRDPGRDRARPGGQSDRLAQSATASLLGRYETNGSGISTGTIGLVPALRTALAERLGTDARANVATIRAAQADASPRWRRAEIDALRAPPARPRAGYRSGARPMPTTAVVHLYTGTPLGPTPPIIAAEIGAWAVLLAEISGGRPDRSLQRTRWKSWRGLLSAGGGFRRPARYFPGTAFEQRGRCRPLAADAEALRRRIPIRRGLIAGEAGPCPRRSASDAARGDAAGHGALLRDRNIAPRSGDRAQGAIVAEIVDPLAVKRARRGGDRGRALCRHDQPIARLA